MDQPVIIATTINKCYRTVHAVKNLSFTVPKSICFGLLGPNGAGKTTMMKMIYGVNSRDCLPEGKLSVFGYDPQTKALAIKFISGVVPQENNLDDELNVEQNLQVFAKFYNLPDDHIILPILDNVFSQFSKVKSNTS
jgi:lipooligosaccharide transport system ATP-binding protein